MHEHCIKMMCAEGGVVLQSLANICVAILNICFHSTETFMYLFKYEGGLEERALLQSVFIVTRGVCMAVNERVCHICREAQKR